VSCCKSLGYTYRAMKDTTTDGAAEQVADRASGIELGAHIKRAEHAIMLRKAEALRALDLTVPQCMALGFLMGGASKTCTHLAREARGDIADHDRDRGGSPASPPHHVC